MIAGGRGNEKEREREKGRKEGDTTRAYTQESGVKYAGEARVFAGTGRSPLNFKRYSFRETDERHR